ncbi:hypothetical protein D3C78_538900 [compost metagenome]
MADALEQLCAVDAPAAAAVARGGAGGLGLTRRQRAQWLFGELGQNAGRDQLLVEGGIQCVQRIHDLQLELLVDDSAQLQRYHLAQRQAQGLEYGLGAERVALRRSHRRGAAQLGQALLECLQGAGAAAATASGEVVQ